MARLGEGREEARSRPGPAHRPSCQTPPSPSPPSRGLSRDVGESGLSASIERLRRQRLGLRFALLPSLAAPRHSSPLLATEVGLKPRTSCRAGWEVEFTGFLAPHTQGDPPRATSPDP